MRTGRTARIYYRRHNLNSITFVDIIVLMADPERKRKYRLDNILKESKKNGQTIRK